MFKNWAHEYKMYKIHFKKIVNGVFKIFLRQEKSFRLNFISYEFMQKLYSNNLILSIFLNFQTENNLNQ